MKGLFAAFRTEIAKVRRSKIFWATILVFVFFTAMIGVFIYLAKHPELVGSSSLIAAKVSVMAINDWGAYLGLLTQMIGMVGIIAFGFVASWVFGREYSDRTVKDLLALPVSRTKIVVAKFAIVFLWCLFLTALLLGFGLLVGALVGIKGWPNNSILGLVGLATMSNEAIANLFISYLLAALLNILLCTPIGLFAGLGRGYLAPLAFVLLMMILSQFVSIGLPSVAIYFPWSVPSILSAASRPGVPVLNAVSYAMVLLTSAIGLAGSIFWWQFADQK